MFLLGKPLKWLGARDAEMDQRSEDKKENKSSTIINDDNRLLFNMFFYSMGEGGVH
jgi:hypothetical protein